jgi:hypothetical protein
MEVNPCIAVGTASTIFTLSKVAWTLGSSLSKLDHDTRIVDTRVRDLAEEVKSLGNECGLLYAELEEGASQGKTGSTLPYDIDDRTWNCVVRQVEEIGGTMQELELFIIIVGEEVQRQRGLDKGNDQIARISAKVCRHTDNLHQTLLLIKT